MDLSLVKEIVTLATAVVGFAILIWRSIAADRKTRVRKEVLGEVLLQVTNHIPTKIGAIEERFESLPCRKCDEAKNEDPEQ